MTTQTVLVRCAAVQSIDRYTSASLLADSMSHATSMVLEEV
jgi:hypothetical protein